MPVRSPDSPPIQLTKPTRQAAQIIMAGDIPARTRTRTLARYRMLPSEIYYRPVLVIKLSGKCCRACVTRNYNICRTWCAITIFLQRTSNILENANSRPPDLLFPRRLYRRLLERVIGRPDTFTAWFSKERRPPPELLRRGILSPLAGLYLKKFNAIP